MSISIHTLRMEGDVESIVEMAKPMLISIHTLRMEGDVKHQASFKVSYISIHTLRMEGDFVKSGIATISVVFQSTPSAWRVT